MGRETEQSPIWETTASCHDGVAGTRLPSNLKQTKIEKKYETKVFQMLDICQCRAGVLDGGGQMI